VAVVPFTARIDLSAHLPVGELVAVDVGLLAEEYDVARRRQVGNFPQAFSHLTLILAARAISRAEADPERAADAAV
jgi:hypothetical protein